MLPLEYYARFSVTKKYLDSIVPCITNEDIVLLVNINSLSRSFNLIWIQSFQVSAMTMLSKQFWSFC